MPSDLHRLLWAELRAVETGMLGLEGGDTFQPLRHLPQPADPVIWFLAEADSDLARQAETAGRAHYILTGAGNRLHAHLSGPIAPRPDRQGLEKAWTPRDETWLPGGLTDIEWLPLRFHPQEARLWLPGADRDDPLAKGVTITLTDWT